MKNFENVSNTNLSMLIDEWIKGERDRQIMKRRLIDCVHYEPLAEEFNLSVQRVCKIVSKNTNILITKI